MKLHGSMEERLGSLVAFFGRLFHTGVDAAPDSTTRRKVLLCNVGAFVGICSLLFFDVIYLYSGSASARVAAFMHLPAYLGFGLVIWFNRRHRHDFASWLLVVNAMVADILPMLHSFGTHLYHHYYFILFAVVPIAVLSARRWPTVVFLFVLNSALFIGFSLHEIEPAPDILEIEGSVVTAFRTLLSFMVILTLGIFYWAYDIYAGRSERELQALSMTDSLTQLPNRRYFENAFLHEVQRARRSHAPMALAFMDIDRFKNVNDTWGHHIGDEVIRMVAATVQRNLRVGSVVGRLGGDELVVLMPDTGLEEAAGAMERVRAAVAAAECECDGVRLHATVSIGVAAVDVEASITAAYMKADEMLYAAKQAGRNAVRCQPAGAHEP